MKLFIELNYEHEQEQEQEPMTQNWYSAFPSQTLGIVKTWHCQDNVTERDALDVASTLSSINLSNRVLYMSLMALSHSVLRIFVCVLI